MLKTEITLTENDCIEARHNQIVVQEGTNEIVIKNTSHSIEGILNDLLGTGHLVDFIKDHREEVMECLGI